MVGMAQHGGFVIGNFHEGIHYGAISALKRAINARKEKGLPLVSGL